MVIVATGGGSNEGVPMVLRLPHLNDPLGGCAAEWALRPIGRKPSSQERHLVYPSQLSADEGAPEAGLS